GRAFELHPRMRELTFEVILRAVFGVSEPARLAAMRAALPALVDLSGLVMLMWLKPELGRVGPWKRWLALKARAGALVVDEVRRRRAGRRPGPPLAAALRGPARLPARALPRGRARAVHVDPFRRRHPALPGRVVRADGDARRPAHGAAAGAAAGGVGGARAPAGAPHHAGSRPRGAGRRRDALAARRPDRGARSG